MPSVGEYPLYDDVSYEAMLNDTARMDVLRTGLERASEELGGLNEAVVVELGSGAAAPWARLALDMGAAEAVAVEVLPHIRDQLRNTVVVDYPKMKVLSDSQYRASISRPDIFVAEVIGTIGSSEGAEHTIGGELRRFGKVRVVPRRCDTYAAAFSWRRVTHGATPSFIPRSEPYLSALSESFGPVDVRLCMANAISRIGLLSGRAVIETCRFDALQDFVASVPCRTTITRDGEMDSILLSVRLEEGDAVADSMKNGSSWMPLVVPLPGDPIKVKKGSRLNVEMSRSTGAGGICPDYRFDVLVIGPEGRWAERTVSLPWRETRSDSTDLHRALHL